MLKSVHMHTWLHVCMGDTDKQKALLVLKVSVSHGDLKPLVALFIFGAAGAQLPILPTNMLHQGTVHGTRAHPVGGTFEEGP